MMMIRLRTLFATALLTVPALTLSAASSGDGQLMRTQPFMRSQPTSAPLGACCAWFGNRYFCWC
jgi:hypothetical protein